MTATSAQNALPASVLGPATITPPPSDHPRREPRARPALDLIGHNDREGTLFYLDPPYWGGEADYGAGMFARGDFQRMADKLRSIEGRFILSINDRPEIREIFSWADVEPVQTTYSVAGGEHAAPAAELLIAKGVNLAAAAPQASLF